MKKVAVFTTSRAEFGLLTPIIEEAKTRNDIEVLLFVGGGHLLKSQGNTIEYIKKKFQVTTIFDFLTEDSTLNSITDSMAEETKQLAEIFKKYKFDIVLILGDRFELLPIVSLSVVNRIPIAHIHGGEITEGAIDEQIRHMITKASHLHFTSCEEYKNNVIKMGEEKNRVLNCGAPAIDNIKKVEKISKKELYTDLGLDENQQTVLFTYHPVTLEEKVNIKTQIQNIFEALDKFDFQVLITAPNVDEGKNVILKEINRVVSNKENYFFIETLGMQRYLSLLPNCKFVIGNSSSGLIEVPYFKIPTINIGDRQKGRIQHISVINTDYTTADIIRGIKIACEKSFNKQISNMEYKFGSGYASKTIIDKIIETEFNSEFLRKKLVFN